MPQGARTGRADAEGRVALHYSARYGKSAVTVALLARHPLPLHGPTLWAEPPRLEAALESV